MKRFIGKSALALAAVLAAASFTAPDVRADDWGRHARSGQGYCEAKGHGYGHYFEWKKTLTDDQRAEMRKLHVTLKKELSSLEAKVRLKKTELKNLIAGDNPDRAVLSRLIDEVSALKKEAMKTRTEHMIKVRSLLTPEQKAAFDMAVLSKKGHGEKHRW